MTPEQFIAIFDGNAKVEWHGDNAVQGLNIIAKYFDSNKTDILQGADHDIIFSVDVLKLVEAGITEEDARELRRLNWMIQDDYLACYV